MFSEQAATTFAQAPVPHRRFGMPSSISPSQSLSSPSQISGAFSWAPTQTLHTKSLVQVRKPVEHAPSVCPQLNRSPTWLNWHRSNLPSQSPAAQPGATYAICPTGWLAESTQSSLASQSLTTEDSVVHRDGVSDSFTHTKEGSTRQKTLQPSPSSRLPSSQTS